MRVLTPSLIASGSTKILKTRELPVKGDILVKVGDSVTPDSVIGKASPEGDIMILRAAEAMGIEPFEVEKGLLKKPGDTVQLGDVLCEHPGLFGLFKSRFISTTSGIFEYFSATTGHIGIRLPARELKINAYLKGKVSEITPGLSVSIETECALIQGIFGVGGERTGVIHFFEGQSSELIEASHIPNDCSGKILCGGSSFTTEALKVAAERKAVGILTASIDDTVLKNYLGYDLGIALTGNENVPMSFIVTEGFGKLSLNKRVEDVLKSGQNALASMNGTTQVRAGAIRPELLIFDISSKQTKEQPLTLDVGSRVRLIRVPNFGVLGEITELPAELQRLETGAFARVVKVKTEHGKTVLVPRSNLELI